jgi:hypothetical protein
MSDLDELYDWNPALINPERETIGPRRKILRKWLQYAWGKHFDPEQGAIWDLAQTVGLPYIFCTEGLWPIIKWFWNLHRILFNPDQTFQQNIDDLRRLRRGIWRLVTEVQHVPEKSFSQDEIEWEEFLGPSLEPRLELFKYKELDYSTDVRATRILELLPGKGLEDIQCRIRTMVLQPFGDSEHTNTIEIHGRKLSGVKKDQGPEDFISYEALSYCWGDNTTFKTPIVCNGARLEITRNLKSALWHLRNKEKVRVLWVDAICINQEDPLEREQQVSHMREIYEQAERVIVWLGESADGSDAALSLCARVAVVAAINKGEMADENLMYHTIMNSYRNDYTWNSKEAREAAASLLKLAGEPTGQEESIQILKDGYHGGWNDKIEKTELFALQNLIKRPWFTRIWITQEIGVAKEAILLCGKTTLDWHIFDVGYSLTLLTNEMRRYLTKEVMINGMGRLTILRRALASKDELTPRQQKLLTLPVLMNSFRKHKATDPRDKIFALYGLTSTDIGAVNLRPDYHSSVENVYKNVTTALMESSKDLYLLSIPRSNNDFSRNLPSWVPDWSDTSSQPVMFSRYSEATDAMAFIPIPSYKASNGTLMPPKLPLNDGHILHLSGFVFDIVAHLGNIYAPPTYDWLSSNFETFTTISPWSSFTSSLKFISDLSYSFDVLYDWHTLALSQPSSLHSHYKNPTEAFWRTLSADWTPNGVEVAAAHYRRWRKQFYPITALRALGIRRLFPALYQGCLILGIGAVYLLVGTHGSFWNMIECASLRRLARTKGGRLVLVPRETRVGDKVALVKGADMPLIIRPCGEDGGGADGNGSGVQWTLVGDSYVHGVMYGEAWDEDRCREIELV